MTRLLLVRHAEAAGSWDEDDDPGLSPDGARVAAALAERLPPGFAVLSSPLARARATAAPIAARHGRPVRVVAAVGEVPSPPEERGARAAWLRGLLASRWPDVSATVQAWRSQVLTTLLGLGEDTVVVTHYVAINVAVGAATGDDRVGCCAPANCSVTRFELDRGRLRLAERGVDAGVAPR